jgi:hypothetical protein
MHGSYCAILITIAEVAIKGGVGLDVSCQPFCGEFWTTLRASVGGVGLCRLPLSEAYDSARISADGESERQRFKILGRSCKATGVEIKLDL